MGLYNFRERFRQPILDGIKCQTIRAERKHQDKPGDAMHLYTGLRQPGASLIARVTCTWVSPIEIWRAGTVIIDGRRLNREELELLARRDGFAGHDEFYEFWRAPVDRLPFGGFVFGWAALEPTP